MKRNNHSKFLSPYFYHIHALYIWSRAMCAHSLPSCLLCWADFVSLCGFLCSGSPWPMQISPTLGLCSWTPPISLCSGIWSLSFSQSRAAWARWLILPQLGSDRHGSDTQQRSEDASDWPGNVDGKAKRFRFKFISRIWFLINYQLVWCSFTDNKRLK